MKRRETKEIDGVLYIKCNKCWEFKEATKEFFAWNHMWYLWLEWDCKICKNRYKSEYSKNNRGKSNSYAREYYKSHRDKILKEHKWWRENNREKFLNRCIEYRKEHKEHHKEYMRDYMNKNKDMVYEWRRKRKAKMWYTKIHMDTWKTVTKLWIRPDVCTICGEKNKIYAHHPDYNKPNEVVFCCQHCHWLIHSGRLECPSPINILDYQV